MWFLQLGIQGKLLLILSDLCGKNLMFLGSCQVVNCHKRHKNTSHPKFTRLSPPLHSHSSNNFTLTVLQYPQKFTFRAILDNYCMEPASNMKHALNPCWYLEYDFSHFWVESIQVTVHIPSTMDSHPKVTISIYSNIVWKTREDCQDLWSTSFNSF